MAKMLGSLLPVGLGVGGDGRSNDEVTDRLSHTYTVLLLVLFAAVVSTKQYVGDPIQCWVPAYFSSNYEDYTNKICWVSNTYYRPFEVGLREDGQPRADVKYVVYYQWVPMILLAQALFFYLPYTLWKVLHPQSGIEVGGIVEAAKAMHDAENCEKPLRYVVRQLHRFCTSLGQRGQARGQNRGQNRGRKGRRGWHCAPLCGRERGNFLVLLSLAVKLLYAVNAVAQLFLLNVFLGTDYHLYGLHVVRSLLRSEDWGVAQRFPRETLCDFRVRQLGNVHRYTVQCVLPINLFNEKIYIFVWFWLVFVATASTVGLCIALCRAAFRAGHVTFVLRQLRAQDRADGDARLVRRFVRHYLRADGVLLLRLLALNTNPLVASEVVAELWDFYRKQSPLCRHDRGDELEEV